MAEVYFVAELGARPHNPSPDEVAALLQYVPADKRTILTLKPGFFPTHPRTGEPLQRNMETEIANAGVDVLLTAETTLSALDVCELYRGVLPPNPEDDAKFGTQWKQDLVRYMSSEAVFSYVCTGSNVYRVVQAIKNAARQANSQGDEWTKIVANVGHVPDPEDFDISLQVLFLGGLTVEFLAAEEKV